MVTDPTLFSLGGLLKADPPEPVQPAEPSDLQSDAPVDPTLPVMFFERRKVEQIVTALEETINLTLLKLLAFDGDRDRWRLDLKRLFHRLSLLRYKPSQNIPSAEFLTSVLYEAAYGGVLRENVGGTMSMLCEQGFVRNGTDIQDVVDRIKAFYRAMPQRLARGDSGADLIDGL